MQRSVTVHGQLADAERHRALLAAQAEQLRARGQRPLRTVGELLEVWLAAEYDWKPSTWQGYRQAARHLSAGPLARRSPVTGQPAGAARRDRGLAARRRSDHDRRAVGPHPQGSARLGVRRAAAARQPLQGMRGPGQPAPRRDVALPVVRALLALLPRTWPSSAPPSRRRSRPAGCTPPNRSSCCCGWPPTPAPAAASSPRCIWTTCATGCCTSTAACPRRSSPQPRPAVAVGSPSARAPPGCGTTP